MLRKLMPLLLCLPLFVHAQQTTEYPEDYLSPEFHAGRRAAYRELMPENSVAFFFASQTRQRNNDVDYIYAQSKNFYYLTGLLEPNSLLVLFKKPVTILGKTGTEFLFVQPRNPMRETWTGKIYGAEGVQQRFKFDNVFTNDKFTASAIDLSGIDTVLSLYRMEGVITKFNYGMDDRRTDALTRMALITDSLILANNKPVNLNRTRAIIVQLRGIKQPEEIVLLEKAATMSVLGHNEVMRAAKPGMTEYQAQAVMEYMFKKNGSEYVGYPSINGAGANSCILHYETNQKLMKDGDLLLSDCAAEYHGYTADVTRTIPINGKFSPEQKIIYELVLEAQDSSFAVSKPGTPFPEVHAASQRVITRGLLKLGIIQKPEEFRTYFMHGTSHFLGLDVHDMGSRGPLEEGAYYTVEPGIYIPPNSKCDPKWWNIGVRIEDDILITKTGYRNLSAGSPRTVAEVEKMMRENSFLK